VNSGYPRERTANARANFHRRKLLLSTLARNTTLVTAWTRRGGTKPPSNYRRINPHVPCSERNASPQSDLNPPSAKKIIRRSDQREGDGTTRVDRFSSGLSLVYRYRRLREIGTSRGLQFFRVVTIKERWDVAGRIKANDVSERASVLDYPRTIVLCPLPCPSNRMRYSGAVTPSGGRGIERPAARTALSSSLLGEGEGKGKGRSSEHYE